MTIKILVVDDERVQRLFMSKLIQKVKPDSFIVTACDGNNAIEKFVEISDFDVVFMDLTMPGCDGFTAAKTIRLMNEDILIYPITAFGDDKELKEKCKEAEMNGYYTKPLKKENIIEVLSKITGSS